MRRGLTSLSNAIPSPDETKELLDEDSFIARRVQERMMRTIVVGIDPAAGVDRTFMQLAGRGFGKSQVIIDEMARWEKLDEVVDFFRNLRPAVAIEKTLAGNYVYSEPTIVVDSLSNVNKEFENASYRRHQQRCLRQERGGSRDRFVTREPEGWRRVP